MNSMDPRNKNPANLVINSQVGKSVVEEGLLVLELGDDVAVERRLQVEPDSLDVDDVIGHLIEVVVGKNIYFSARGQF